MPPTTTISIPQVGAAGAVATHPDGTIVVPPPRVVRVRADEIEQVVRYTRPRSGYAGEVVMVDGTRHETTDVDRVLRDRREALAAVRTRRSR